MDTNHSNEITDDLRLAPIADINRFLNHDDGIATTIAEAAAGDDYTSHEARTLIRIVGSAEALANLHAQPHHDPGFERSGIAPSEHEYVDDMLLLLEAATPCFDREYKTIMWRTLRTLTLDESRPLRRRNRPERIAAAIAWVAFAANGAIGRRCRWGVGDLWSWFGVSPCADIGAALARQIRTSNVGHEDLLEVSMSLERSASAIVATDSLLHSSYRKRLIERRNHLQQRIDDHCSYMRGQHPIARVGLDGDVGVRATPVVVRWAAKGVDDSGRARINIALGEGLADMQVLAVSIPDARRLISAVEMALGDPMLSHVAS